MSKRKSNTPVKLPKSILKTNSFSFSGTSGFINGDDNNLESQPPSTSQHVSFNLLSDDSEEESEKVSTGKVHDMHKKRILTDIPKKAVILGEIPFYLNVSDDLELKLEDVKFNVFIDKADDIKLEIGSVKNKTKKLCVDLTIPEDLPEDGVKDLLQRNYIWVIQNIEDVLLGVLNVTIVITPDKTPINKTTNVVELFFGNNLNPLIDSRRRINYTEEFFKELKNFQINCLNYEPREAQHEKLIPLLRPYQEQAVQWMLSKESKELQPQNCEWLSSIVKEFKSVCGRTLYYNVYSNVLSLQLFDFPPYPRCGILADEMGLGKTVVVIALVLNHPRDIESEEDNEDFLPAIASGSVKRRKSTNFNNDVEIIEMNKEDCLDVDEKLIFDKAKKGSALKRALSEWYESKLASYSASSSRKRRRFSDEEEIKCLCGNVAGKDLCVECPECLRYQHSECVGYDSNYVYYCPQCWAKQKLVKSKGTLVIAPVSIYIQWREEIKKHVANDAFDKGVYMYDGIKDGFIQPSVLSSYDIVITTYTVLRNEINRAMPNESDRRLRNEERFLRPCSPLIQVQWWRVCLDEAQMVEVESKSAISQMAKMLSAVNRWSVTGTPIQKSIGDLYYLIDWLGVEPFNEKIIWENFLYLPFRNGNEIPLYTLFSQVFWRNSKEDVAGELMIPEQTTRYHWLKFTAIEQNFYMREHTTSCKEFEEGLRKLKLDMEQTIESLDKHTLTRVLAPLLNLRQACSHPLAVRGNKIAAKKGGMTLTQLLNYLHTKTKNECEEALRNHVACLNGLGGIHYILEEWPAAVDYYRQVLQITEEYKEKVKVDTLQQIHALTNLSEILKDHNDGIPPTLRDDKLKEDAKTLEDKYMQKITDEYGNEQELLQKFMEKVSSLSKNFESGPEIWWVRLMHLITIDNSIEELMDKITNEFSADETENKKDIDLFLSRVSTVEGIEVMLRRWIKNIEEQRHSAIEELEELCEVKCDPLVYEAIDCHLRTFTYENVKKKKCRICACESVLLDYECTLFATSKKKFKRKDLREEYLKVINGAVTKGSWKAHKAERVLRVILNFGKLKVAGKNQAQGFSIRDGKNHIQMLDVMKKEFKQLRVVWRMLSEQVQAKDEVSMSKLRLRLRLPGEPIPPKPTGLTLKTVNVKEMIYIIEHHDVEPQKLKLTAESQLSISEFKKKYGTLLYLGNLGKSENSKPEPCPVCRVALENEWCVLQCGHSYCIECIRTLLSRTIRPAVTCPVCREITSSKEISFVDLSDRDENQDINVVGEHSTKVDAILRTLLELKQNDPKVKVLIFSTWEVVLKVLEKALDENNISFRRMPGYNYQVHLQQFRNPELNVTALLLPISWGSKGLNLTEASHVFLVEPIMNPAEELQAIGRVHRIGQTKETVVHRFLINGTIEEKIHSAVSEAKDKWDKKKATLEDLKNLFVMNENFTKQNVN